MIALVAPPVILIPLPPPALEAEIPPPALTVRTTLGAVELKTVPPEYAPAILPLFVFSVYVPLDAIVSPVPALTVFVKPPTEIEPPVPASHVTVFPLRSAMFGLAGTTPPVHVEPTDQFPLAAAVIVAPLAVAVQAKHAVVANGLAKSLLRPARQAQHVAMSQELADVALPRRASLQPRHETADRFDGELQVVVVEGALVDPLGGKFLVEQCRQLCHIPRITESSRSSNIS